LDLTAAPGGKSLQTSALMDGGYLVSNEVIKTRCNPLRWNIVRERRSNIIVTNKKPQELADNLPNWFDLIIVDAPCSGEGLFQKKKHSFDAWSEKNVKFCAKRQQSILRSANQLLKAGGILVYSTCTFAKEENEDQIKFLLNNGYSAVELPLYGGISKGISDDPEIQKCCRRIFPHKTQGAGAFAAVVKKNNAVVFEKRIPMIFGKEKCKDLKKIKETIHIGENFYYKTNDFVQLFSYDEIPKYLTEIALQIGLPIAQVKKDVQWLHSAIKFIDEDHCIEVSEENLEKFVIGESFPALLNADYYIVTWKGHRLGWIKSNGKQAQNLLPAPLRMKQLNNYTLSELIK
jgi:NOL1/NOP2/fmu family ribosome biogenesis protein